MPHTYLQFRITQSTHKPDICMFKVLLSCTVLLLYSRAWHYLGKFKAATVLATAGRLKLTFVSKSFIFVN